MWKFGAYSPKLLYINSNLLAPHSYRNSSFPHTYLPSTVLSPRIYYTQEDNQLWLYTHRFQVHPDRYQILHGSFPFGCAEAPLPGGASVFLSLTFS